MPEKRRLDNDNERINNNLVVHEHKFELAKMPKFEPGQPNKKKSLDLPHIFEKKVWVCILKHVKDSSVLENLQNSSAFLRTLLLSRQTCFLFQSVWGILAKNFENNYQMGFSPFLVLPPPVAIRKSLGNVQSKNNESSSLLVSEDNATDTFYKKAATSRRGWMQVVKKLRLVCSSWCQAVDYFYQNHYRHFELRCEISTGYLACSLDSIVKSILSKRFCEFNGTKFCTEFIDHFGSTHGEIDNPFIGRGISLLYGHKDHTEEQAEEFENAMLQILEKYGDHIWYCEIYDQNATIPNFYSKVEKVLRLMPNLKVLHLGCRFSNKMFPEEWQAVQTEVNQNRLQALNQLKMLSIVSRLPAPIFEELIKASSGHVVTLDVCQWGLCTVLLPNLSTLSIKFSAETDFQNLKDSPVLWHLTKVCLDFEEVLLKRNELFSLVQEKWGASLVHLNIRLPDEKEDTTIPELHLPHLTYLKLTMKTSTCLDFLLSLEGSLCTLEVMVLDTLAVESEKEIKFWSCVNNPLESNVWKHLSKLDGVGFAYRDIIEWSTNRRKWSETNQHI